MTEWIELKGVYQNNLKHISVKLPRNKFIVITGVSGSGKSSLAFDVINNEGRRKYFVNLSGHARKYLDKFEKPLAESISGLTPTIAVSQTQNNYNPRSTVGTLSEIYDLLRLLFARLGTSALENLNINRSLFSFNTIDGACPQCNGLGLEDQIDASLLIEDENRSIRDKAFKITNPQGYIIYSQVTIDALNQVCMAHGFNVDIPWIDLTEEQKKIVLNGSNIITIPYGKHTLESRMKWAGITAKPREEGFYKGILPVMNEILKRDRNPNILRFAKTVKCSKCHGKRLSDEALSVEINGKNIDYFTQLSLDELADSFQKFEFKNELKETAQAILEPILKRIHLLQELGLGYLTCSRSANTLSNGEIQRLRLSKQIASELRNITFVFDEPSAGIHASVNKQVLQKLKELVNNGNTVIAVEHDRNTILKADWILEIGPGAGLNGGEVLFNGTLTDFLASKHQSLTLDYLHEKKKITLPFKEVKSASEFFVRNACINNLKNIDVAFRYQAMNVISGISGAGKSSLAFQTIIPLAKNSYSSQINAIGNPRLENFHFDQILHVDQSPIGKTARSTPATYTKIFDTIRQLFAALPESKKKKYTQSTFSYNTIGGRCEKCEGAGKIETGMHFLGNIEQVCDACNGNRYSDELNLIHYQGTSISEILNLSFNEAYDFFSENAKIQKQLRIVKTIGLGYLKLGQSSNSLSGGEAQRIKLAAELIRGASKNSLYLFNEPSTGLHYYDIQILLNLFSDLLKKGNTLLIIEHNLDIIKNAHRIIDIGPGSNHQGGNLVFSGNFDDFLLQKNSITAQSFSTNLENTFRDETSKTKNKSISFRSIRTHNLKNINIEIPDNKTTVIIGKSGSGKTSLAFDTIFAESQYRFTESFPNYVRQFTNHFSQAQFDTVSGLTPVIGLRQKNQMNDPRSTLATFVDIYDYYRLLYARFGDYLCPNCGSILHKNSCTKCAFISTQKLSASHFSFNQAEGSCTNCKGLGTVLASAPELWIENPEISISEGAFKKHKSLQFYADPNGQYMAILEKVGQHFEIDYNLPINQLSYQALQYAFFGSGKTIYQVTWNYKRKNRKGNHQFTSEWIGFAQLLLDEYYRKYANGKGQDILPFLVEKECPTCLGKRLNEEVLKIKIQGKDISELSGLSVNENILFFKQLQENKKIDPQLIETILLKLEALQAMKLGYLQLNRLTRSLSGGEYQRTLLATQFTGNLSGITYIIDEPSSGLHPADIPIVLNSFNRLKVLGNTIIVIDHNPQIIKKADFLVELGPESGNAGGEIIFSEKKQHRYKSIDSSLQEAKKPLDEFNSSKGNDLFIRKANANNLKNIDVSFKLNAINVVCGVSGSGKTSLLRDVLYQSYKNKNASNCATIQGFSLINDLQWVSARSGILNQQSVASYFGLWDEIRKHFANQQKAKELGFKSIDFSLNSKANQCPTCKGQGIHIVKLDFLNDINSLCESCGGSGFTQNILQVKYKEKSISEILHLTIDEVLNLFISDNVLFKKLALIQKIGLSYLKLNQKLKQLSHGEYQRARLIHQIMNTQLNNTVFVFDEPSKGLSQKDLKYLFELFSLLIKSNSSIIIIEHNPELIKRADYILELGPGAGNEGGNLIFQGVFTDLLKNKSSKTAEYFKSNDL